jgi:hypothetical protein
MNIRCVQGDVARILHHVGQELAEQPVYSASISSSRFQTSSAFCSLRRGIGVEHVLELGLHQAADMRGARGRRDRRLELAAMRDGALGDVLGEVADALDVEAILIAEISSRRSLASGWRRAMAASPAPRPRARGCRGARSARDHRLGQRASRRTTRLDGVWPELRSASPPISPRGLAQRSSSSS